MSRSLIVVIPLQWGENSREKKIADKRVRMDKEPLENLLFRLFEKQVHPPDLLMLPRD